MTIALQWWCFERERQAWRTRRRRNFLCSWGAYEVIWFLIFGFAAVQSDMPQQSISHFACLLSAGGCVVPTRGRSALAATPGIIRAQVRDRLTTPPSRSPRLANCRRTMTLCGCSSTALAPGMS